LIKYFFSCCHRREKLTTNQITDMFDKIDDTDEDPDNEVDSDDKDPASDQEDGGRTASMAPEVKVYIEPPVEHAEGDKDHAQRKLPHWLII
jgi:hypothetical protein